MAFWAVRAGKHGENEAYALDRGVVTIGWEDLGDLAPIKTRDELASRVATTYAECAPTTRSVWTGEVWAFQTRMQEGDLVALPLKSTAAIAFGRIAGPYRFRADGPFDGKHQRAVRWIRTDVARSDVPQDILRSLGSTLTVFQVSRESAEARILALLEGHSTSDSSHPPEQAEEAPLDIEQYARDQITSYIASRFRRHDLSRLVASILVAQGYRVHVSPPGPDGGVDILAGTGDMGFQGPRLAVQVKSSDAPLDVGVLRELQGVMPGFGASHGLLVSWGGFNTAVLREARKLFFQIRLWTAEDLVLALQENYGKLSADLQAELPLKRIWTVVDEG